MVAYLIEQKITPLVNRYAIYDTDDSGNKASLKAFVQQKRFAFKEGFTFYADEARQQPLFTVKAEKIMDVHGNFIVANPDGNQLGRIRKAFKSSLLVSTWNILDSSDDIMSTARERSTFLAVFRRIWQFIPFLSDIPFLVKYHFDYLDTAGNKQAEFVKTTLLRDHYRLTISDNTLLEKIGWETLIAQAVLLDALQGR